MLSNEIARNLHSCNIIASNNQFIKSLRKLQKALQSMIPRLDALFFQTSPTKCFFLHLNLKFFLRKLKETANIFEQHQKMKSEIVFNYHRKKT